MTIARTMLRPRVEPMRPDRPHRAPEAATGLQDFVAGLAAELAAAPVERIDAAITEAIGRIGALAAVDRAYVFAVRGDRLVNTNEWCSDGTDPQVAMEVSTSMYRWCTARILAGHVLYVPRVRELPDDEVDKSMLSRQAIQSVLAVPIILRGRVVALVGFDTVRRERHWTADTIALLKIAAAIFGNAMARRDAEQALLEEKEFFGNVAQTLGSLVLVLAPDGRCLHVNRAFSDLTGLSAEQLSGTGWQTVVPQDARDAARTAMRNALAGVRTQFEGPLVSHSGERRTILWTGSVVRKLERETGYVVITGIDLTETLRLRNELEQTRRVDSLGRIAAKVVHEFNNVLMSISTSAMAMRRHPDRQQDVQRCAEHIENAVKRGAAIAGGVMRFVRPATPVRQTIDARTWLHALADEMRVVLRARPGAPEIVVAPPAGEPPLVSADPLELHQVFSNLVLNAAEAMAGGGTVTVSVEGSERGVHWRVKDTGSGIPPVVVERIFEPLFTTKPRGNGLGLAIVQQIVSMHGGQVSVESAQGVGTTVHVFLPAACA